MQVKLSKGGVGVKNHMKISNCALLEPPPPPIIFVHGAQLVTHVQSWTCCRSTRPKACPSLSPKAIVLASAPKPVLASAP